MNIYRSVNSPPGNTNYYLITSLNTADPASNFTYTDNATDASLIAGGNVMSFYGPAVSDTTLLQNVVVYDPSTGAYSNAFPSNGTLQFTGSKGGNTLTTQSLAVTATTTMKDLANFLQGSLGIQSPPGNDPNNPIPLDSGTGQAAGVTITSSGQINIVSDDGTSEAVSIGLSALQFVPSSNSANTSSVAIPFNSIQTAQGVGVTAQMTAYDSLGTPLSVTITAVLEKTTASYTEYRWYADCGQNDLGAGQTNIAVGTGTVLFDGQGNFLSASNTTVSIGRAQEPAVKPLEFNLDFSQVSGLATSTPSLSVASQDGSAPGVLSSFNISNNGLINGVFSNGISRDLGQILLARFSNPIGLEQQGQNMYAAGVDSGLPIIANPGAEGTGTIAAGSLELSNTDIGASLINLITTQTMYSSNTRVITTAQNMFNELLQLLQ
jgi:flagellar hook protein FlgE